ncbi:MAG: SRPBCC family protein [Rhodospirillaceae bacterium]
MTAGYDLVLEKVINAPKEKLYRCWTEPELMMKWFTPKPWTTVRVERDLRAGGACLVVMRSPEGQEFPNPGVYLEVVPNEKIVFTDAFTAGWVPKDGAPFFVAEVTFEDAGDGKTRYRAVARHWTAESRDQHDKMGFHQGWGKAAEQLEEVAATI